jgi:hypothetical protein
MNSGARSLNARERKLPPAIQRLLIAYPEQLKTAYLTKKIPADRTHHLAHHAEENDLLEGVLIWRDQGDPSHWRASQREVSLADWTHATPKQRRRWWGGKTFEEALHHPTLGDQLLQLYPVDRDLPKTLPINFEPGRVRAEWYFKRMYGTTRRKVGEHITMIRWGKQRLRVTRINEVDKKLKAIYRELVQLERRFKPFYQKSAGAFVWR